MSDAVIISAISTAGGIIIAYITYVVSQKVQRRKAERQPKDRMEQMFDGYERLIKQKDLEDERKAKLINLLEWQVEGLKQQLRKTEEQLEVAKDDLHSSRKENDDLRKALRDIREEYKHHKGTKTHRS